MTHSPAGALHAAHAQYLFAFECSRAFLPKKSIELYYELQNGAFSFRNRRNIPQALWHQSHSDTTPASMNSHSRLLLYRRILCLTCYELSVLKGSFFIVQ